MKSSTEYAITREVILGVIVGYLAMTILFELWKLYTEWLLEMERQRARIYFEEKRRAERCPIEPTDILTIEGRTNKASS